MGKNNKPARSVVVATGILALALTTACYRDAKPATSADQAAPLSAASDGMEKLDARVTMLERGNERIADLSRKMELLAKLLEQLGSIDHVAHGRSGAAPSDDDATLRIAELEDRIATLERTLRTVGTTRPSPRPRPNRPTPTDVYAIPLGNSPYTGPRFAKVTIVEAFEFA